MPRALLLTTLLLCWPALAGAQLFGTYGFGGGTGEHSYLCSGIDRVQLPALWVKLGLDSPVSPFPLAYRRARAHAVICQVWQQPDQGVVTGIVVDRNGDFVDHVSGTFRVRWVPTETPDGLCAVAGTCWSVNVGAHAGRAMCTFRDETFPEDQWPPPS